MEAKDTVISWERMGIIGAENIWAIEEYCKAQAEISFKAGYEAHKAELCNNCDTPLFREGELYQKLDESKRAEIWEVVRWAILNSDITRHPHWQAKLKEWGVG